MKANIFTLLFLLLVLSHSIFGQEKQCAVNEIYNECGTACPETCETTRSGETQACILMCVSGCFCQNDYVRDHTKNGECVPKKSCLARSPKEGNTSFATAIGDHLYMRTIVTFNAIAFMLYKLI